MEAINEKFEVKEMWKIVEVRRILRQKAAVR